MGILPTITPQHTCTGVFICFMDAKLRNTHICLNNHVFDGAGPMQWTVTSSWPRSRKKTLHRKFVGKQDCNLIEAQQKLFVFFSKAGINFG